MANPQKMFKTNPKSYPRYFPTYPQNGKTTVTFVFPGFTANFLTLYLYYFILESSEIHNVNLPTSNLEGDKKIIPLKKGIIAWADFKIVEKIWIASPFFGVFLDSQRAELCYVCCN